MNTTYQISSKLGLICFTLLASFVSSADTAYLSIGAGFMFPQKISLSKNYVQNSLQTTETIKQSKLNGEALVGAGMYLTDSLRIEAVLAKVFFGKSKVSQVINGIKTDVADITPNVNSIQIRGYFDVVDLLDVGKLYIGGGAGLSQIKAKISNLKKSDNYSPKAQNKTRLSWLLAFGGSMAVAPSISLGIEYNYKDLGKISGQNFVRPSLKGHCVLGKIMVSI